jgi:ethanolamine utilization protein EutA
VTRLTRLAVVANAAGFGLDRSSGGAELHHPHGAHLDDGEFDEQRVDDIRLTTVGVDIGSATTHFLISRITMRRLGLALRSRYEVVDREELFRSDVIFTPYRSSTEIDSDRLREYFAGRLELSGLSYDDIDTGVVMLTGEAARKHNAQSIAELFANSVGKFVCASAGHHLEARMAAHGSGAVAHSRSTGGDVVNIDIGGGTAKFSLIRGGRIVGTSAVNVGGRVVLQQDGLVARIDASADRVARELGVKLELGRPAAPETLDRLAGQLADCLVEYLTTPPPHSPLTTDLCLTPPPDGLPSVRHVVLSGGVSEYVANPAAPEMDLGRSLAARLAEGVRRAGRTLSTSRERMRATVVGLSQFTTQVSGDTIFVSTPGALPITNAPVLTVDLRQLGKEDPAEDEVFAAIADSFRASGREGLSDVVALNVVWTGKPYFRNLSALAGGVARAAEQVLPAGPLLVVLSQDCASSLGRVLHDRLGLVRDIVCMDGLSLHDNDFIDVGVLMEHDSVLPVVVKTLVFPNQTRDASDSNGAVAIGAEPIGRILDTSASRAPTDSERVN